MQVQYNVNANFKKSILLNFFLLFHNLYYLCSELVYYIRLFMILSDTIKERRAKLKISQADLAEMARVSLATVKDIERGKGNPSLQTIEKLLDILGLEIVYRIRQTV